MAKKYIDQELFDYMVCGVALTSMTTVLSENEFLEMAWKSYENDLIDDGAKADILEAVRLAVEKLVEIKAPSHAAFLKLFQAHIESHNLDGTRKRGLKKIFGGLWFTKSVQNPKRVDDFLKRMVVFYFSLITSTFRSYSENH